MTNAYGERVVPKYEVVLEKQIAPADYESVDFTMAENYRDAVKKAKALSLEYPDTIKWRVNITCYFEDDTSSYNMVWWEYYSNGKKDCRTKNDRI